MVYETSTILIYQIVLYLNIFKKKIEFLNIFNTHTHLLIIFKI